MKFIRKAINRLRDYLFMVRARRLMRLMKLAGAAHGWRFKDFDPEIAAKLSLVGERGPEILSFRQLRPADLGAVDPISDGHT